MIKWPKSPKLWERFSYIDPIGGSSLVEWEWCGAAGWRHIR
jgi:hypothetical protein